MIDLRPRSARLDARVFENRGAGVRKTLFFSIEIDMHPFEWEGEVSAEPVALDFIELGEVGRFADLVDRHFELDPEDVDGSFCLDGVHNPVEVEWITFRQDPDRGLELGIALKIDFTHEGPEVLGVRSERWAIPLTVDMASMDRIIATRPKRRWWPLGRGSDER